MDLGEEESCAAATVREVLHHSIVKKDTYRGEERNFSHPLSNWLTLLGYHEIEALAATAGLIMMDSFSSRLPDDIWTPVIVGNDDWSGSEPLPVYRSRQALIYVSVNASSDIMTEREDNSSVQSDPRSADKEHGWTFVLSVFSHRQQTEMGYNYQSFMN